MVAIALPIFVAIRKVWCGVVVAEVFLAAQSILLQHFERRCGCGRVSTRWHGAGGFANHGMGGESEPGFREQFVKEKRTVEGGGGAVKGGRGG